MKIILLLIFSFSTFATTFEDVDGDRPFQLIEQETYLKEKFDIYQPELKIKNEKKGKLELILYLPREGKKPVKRTIDVSEHFEFKTDGEMVFPDYFIDKNNRTFIDQKIALLVDNFYRRHNKKEKKKLSSSKDNPRKDGKVWTEQDSIQGWTDYYQSQGQSGGKN